MADFTALKTAIQTYIKQNGNEEITGVILQEILLSVVTTLGDSAINDLVTALANEVAARQNADGTLQTNINNEATARGNADTALSNRLGSTITAENTAAEQIGAEAEAREAADTALQGLIDGITDNIENGYVYAGIATPSSTPATGKVFYLALTAGTYTNFDNTVVSQGINILKYNGSAWSLDAFIGIDDTPTPNSPKLVKSGGAFDSVMTNGSAFDISAHFASGGTLATYANLDAALTALNTLSASYKRGGMSIKFVRTSDNKYVQYRLMANSFSTTESDWQGVDTEPTESNNLIESKGVFNNISSIYNLTGKVSVDRCYSSQISAKGNEVGITLTISSSSENWSLFGILLGKSGDLKANRNVYVVVDMPNGAAYDINQVALSKNPASFGPSYIIAPSSSLGRTQIIGSDGEMSAVVYSIPDTIDLSSLSDNDNVYLDFGCKETNVQLSGRTNNIYVCKNYIPYSYNSGIVNGGFYANHEAIEKVRSDVSVLNSTVQGLDTEINGIEANTQVLVKTPDDFNIYTDNNYEYEYLSDGYGIKIVNTKEDTSTSTWNIFRLYVGTVAELKQSLRTIYLSDITISNSTDIHFIKTREGSWSPSNTIGDGEIISRSGNEVVIGLSDNTISALSGLSDTQQVYLAMGYRSDTQHSITSSEASAYLSYISLDISEFKECLKKKDLTIPYILNPRIKKIEDTIGELIQKEKVVCWGDSLTAGAGADSLTNYQTVITKLNQLTGLSLSADIGRTYPEMLNILLSDDYIVSNMGVGGETINTIGAREGANTPILQPSFTLPADGSEVKVGERTNENNMGLLSSWNETEQTLVNVLMQGSPSLGINPCYIQGIPCTLGYRDSSYYLKRNVAVNDNVNIPANSELVLNGMKQSIDADVAILWCYQNGGYYNESDLLDKIIKMVDALPTKKFIVLNLHSQLTGTDALKKYFGNKFFNWNQYVTSNALTDFGITPTSQDIADMANHLAPTSLRKDNVHLNSAGYAILAYQIYLHGLSLGYWN